jgi:hypothetical protein
MDQKKPCAAPQITFDDVSVDLKQIPRELTESHDKRVLDFLLSSDGNAAVQKVMDGHGELVHTNPSNGEGADLMTKLHKQVMILEAYSRKGGLSIERRSSITKRSGVESREAAASPPAV